VARQRNSENSGLPARWRLYHGAYYFHVPPGQEKFFDGKKQFRLGTTLPEAFAVWSKRMESKKECSTIGQLLTRYAIEEVPKKAPKTQRDAADHIVRLTAVFGEMALETIKPQHLYKYIDFRKEKKINANGRTEGGLAVAQREVKTLSGAFTKAVEWGLIDRHPFKHEIRMTGQKPRDRYIENWEIVECLALPTFRKSGSVLAIQAYIRIKLMTGMARSDLLRLTVSDLKDDGVHIQRHKTRKSSGKRTVYEMTPDLSRAIEQAKSARPVLSSFLFCNTKGQPYINEETGESSGWDSMWQRFMARILKETKVEAKFTEHDLRAKCASDAASLDQARALLSHADSRTTQSVYRRKPERVMPLGGVK
jgi:integrase